MKTPRELGLPYDEWRSGQRLALRTILSAPTPHVVINAPTGSGKSTLALALPKLDARRHVITTTTLALQDQYVRTAPWLVDVRGMSNYECLAAKAEFKDWFRTRRKIMCDDGPCHSGASCGLKEGGCLYFDRYRAALGAQTALPNLAYWLSMRRFAKGLGVAQRLVIDEAHTLPEQLMDACAITVPRSILDHRLPKTWKQWRLWATRMHEELAPAQDDDQRVRRERLQEALRSLSKIDRTWAWDAREGEVYFAPTIPKLLMPMLQTFDGHTQNVYLSATVTPAMFDLLGIERDDLTYWEMKSHFPVERRPVYLVPGARVDYNSMKKQETIDAWLEAHVEIVQARADRCGLVHPVSFERTRQLAEVLRGLQTHVVYEHEQGKPAARVVEAYKRHADAYEHWQLGSSNTDFDSPPLLISPSIMTGFDFPHHEARFQILSKVPFPDTSSAILRARMKATPRYREHLTAQQLQQACGRIVRAEEDWGETFIVDEHARWFVQEHRDLLADWFVEAIVMTRRASITPPPLTGPR